MLKKISLYVKIIISAALIWFVLSRTDLSKFSEVWSRVNFWYFLAAFVFIAMTAVFNSIKWHLLLEVQNIKVPLGKVLDLYLVGYFFNNFFTGIGEIKRIYDLSKETGKCQEVLTSVFIERWTGIVTQVFAAVLALAWAYKDVPDVRGVLMICGVLFAGLLVLFILPISFSRIPYIEKFEKIHNWLDDFRRAYSVYMKRPDVLFKAFLLSMTTPVALILVHWFLVKGLGYTVSLWAFILFIPIISVFAQVPVSFSGLGIQEVSFVVLLGMVGVPSEVALSLSILSHLSKLSVGIVGGILYAVRKSHWDRIPATGDPHLICQIAAVEGN